MLNYLIGEQLTLIRLDLAVELMMKNDLQLMADEQRTVEGGGTPPN